METAELKSKLLMYEGGGYDGCIYEWNMCVWDKNGMWYDIYSSGKGGADTEEKAKNALDGTGYYDTGWDPNCDLVDLTDEKQVEEWQKTYHASIVVGIVNILNGNNFTYFIKHPSGHRPELDMELFARCADCDERTEEPIGADPRGQGGIVIANETIYCEDCYSNHTCPYCGEYYSDENDAYKCYELDTIHEMLKGVPAETKVVEFYGEKCICHPETQFRVEVPGLFDPREFGAEYLNLPLFKKLTEDCKREFREDARVSFREGFQLRELHHPIWQDEWYKQRELFEADEDGYYDKCHPKSEEKV